MEWVSGNIFIRSNRLDDAGDLIMGHQHNFDHTLILYTGSIHIKAKLQDGSTLEREFGAVNHPNGRHVLIKAGVEHEITALEPGTEYWCVYSHRTPQGEVTQTWDGWTPAYQ